MSLREEIKQTRPFKSPLEELSLNIIRTAAELSYTGGEMMKQYGLTTTQYNVLRILRGAGDNGLPCGAISERMITRDSDITRLLDRLTVMRLVERDRTAVDRRVVAVKLTAKGGELLAELDPVVERYHQEHLGHLDEATVSALIAGLEKVRERTQVNA
jgi:DNA-binding MarR family transcriptional regulator